MRKVRHWMLINAAPRKWPFWKSASLCMQTVESLTKPITNDKRERGATRLEAKWNEPFWVAFCIYFENEIIPNWWVLMSVLQINPESCEFRFNYLRYQLPFSLISSLVSPIFGVEIPPSDRRHHLCFSSYPYPFSWFTRMFLGAVARDSCTFSWRTVTLHHCQSFCLFLSLSL